jgi:hypothetical protein
MRKVRLFVCADMTVIDIGGDVYTNFHSYNYAEVVANVVDIVKQTFTRFDGCVDVSYKVITDYTNPYRNKQSAFLLDEENYNKIQWVE